MLRLEWLSSSVDETVIWTGECAEGMGEGTGTLNWVWDGGKESSEATGRLQEGKRHGQWVLRESSDGGVDERQPYVTGEACTRQWVLQGCVRERLRMARMRRGRGTGSGSCGTRPGTSSKARYVEGTRHGQWV